MTRKSPWLWITLPAGGLLAGALGAAFVVLGLEQADQLAGVVGVFLALAGLGTSVYGVVVSIRPSPPDAGTAGSGETRNTIEGGTFHAPVTMARDVTGPPTPADPGE